MPALVARSAIAVPTAWAAAWLPPYLSEARELLVARRGAGQRLAFQVVDDLRRDVFMTASDAQARPLERATGTLADTKRATLTLAGDFLLSFHGTEMVRCFCAKAVLCRTSPAWPPAPTCLLLCRRLAGLAADDFAIVADALAFVGLRLADRPDLGRELAHLLFIHALDDNVRLIGTGDRQSVRNRFLHFVGKADAELQHLALNRARYPTPWISSFFS